MILRMQLSAIISLLAIYFINTTFATANLVIHTEGSSESITVFGEQCQSGALFNEKYANPCLCVNGLWALYQENCEQATEIVAGSDGQCIHVPFTIRKATLLSPKDENSTVSSAASFDQDFKSLGGKFVSVSGRSSSNFVLPGYPVVVTSGNESWRLPAHSLCMKPTDSKTRQFCIFNHGIHEEYKMDVGCSNEDKIVEPLVCAEYSQANEDADLKSCESTKRRFTRSAARQQGRVFLGAVEGLVGNATNDSTPVVNLTKSDENNGLNVSISNPILNSELWNFMTLRAQERLGIRQARQLSFTDTPSLAFLDISKQIMQRACPDHYVSDSHFEVAVGAFISVQLNHMKFTDSFLDAATSERIEDALRGCLANISEPYPFLERIGKKAISCNGSIPITHGSYNIFNKTLELSIPEQTSARNTEPIVETVWKVFLHAHSACFPFFQNSLNDHHQFTTLMLYLFTNDINDIWKNTTSLTPDVYSGFLGDAVDLMDSVDYCSLYSRLESKYPWDLPRPNKQNARRKRDTNVDQKHQYQCLGSVDSRNFCPINSAFLDEDPTDQMDYDIGFSLLD